MRVSLSLSENKETKTNIEYIAVKETVKQQKYKRMEMNLG